MVCRLGPRKHISFLAVLAIVLLWSPFATGEINLDTTLGGGGALLGPDYQLDESMGRVEGPNAYFSFGRVVIDPGQTLTIDVPIGVTRIFLRVTDEGAFAEGFDTSGPITISEPVDLIVLSPQGLSIQEGASFDFDGLLSLTTADAVTLEDDGEFQVGLTPTEFGTGAPTEYTFDGDNGVVSVSTVTLNRATSDLLLAGSTVRVQQAATLGVNAGGHLGLAAVGPEGQVSWNDSDLQVSALGDRVEVVGGATLAVSRGRLAIAGGTLQLEDCLISQTDTSPDGILQLAGNVIGLVGVDAELTGSQTPQIRIEGGAIQSSEAAFSSDSTEETGGLLIDADTISLLDTTFEFSSVDGAAAELVLRAGGLAELESSIFRNQSTGDGAVQGVSIAADQLLMVDSTVELVSPSASVAGVLLQAVDRIDVTDGSTVSVTTSGQSADSIRALAGNVIGIVRSEISIDTGDGGVGDGELILEAEQVVLSGAQLEMVAHSGDRGQTAIAATQLDVSDGTEFSMCSDNPLRSGNISLSTTSSITFRGQSATAISTCNVTRGDAGIVRLESPALLFEHDLELNLEAPNGDDGALQTDGADSVLVTVAEQPATTQCNVRRADVQFGLDDGLPGGSEADGVLQDEEVDDEASLCVNFEDEEDLLYRFTDRQATDECPDGVLEMEFGSDKSDDGRVDDEEIVGEIVACRGERVDPSGLDDGSTSAPTSDSGCSCRSTTDAQVPISFVILLLVGVLSWRRSPSAD